MQKESPDLQEFRLDFDQSEFTFVCDPKTKNF